MPKQSPLRADGCLMPTHYLINAALGSGIYGINVYPTSFPRALLEADAWDYFRVKQCKFRLHPPVAAPAQAHVAGYVPGVQDTPPTSMANVAELINATVLGARATVPTQWVNVPKKELAGPFPWYKSLPGTTDATEESPGALYVAGTTTESFLLEVFVVFEFKASIAGGNTPFSADLRARIREERLLAVKEKRRVELLSVIGSTPIRSSTLKP